MKTIPVEQISAMPLLLILEIIAALIVLTGGMLIVNKTLKQNNTKKLLASGLVGLVAGAAMVGILFGMNAHVANTNEENLRAAVTESGQNLTDEQFAQLETQNVVTVDEDKTIVLQDEGTGYSLTVLDTSDNNETQTEEEKEREKQIKENDF